MDDSIENVPSNIKSCIYKAVMEGITNGIKHGNAEVFDIEIIKSYNNILFKISNNGLGCNNIKKSNGIKGIEKRITNLRGTVEFYSKNDSDIYILKDSSSKEILSAIKSVIDGDMLME